MPKQVYVINPIGGAMQDMLPVAAYCRVSSNSDDQRHSYYAQVKEYTEQIESNPEWTLAGIYADPGITGTSAAKRKEFQRLMKDCRAGKVKRILVKSVSRFARNKKECLEYVRELKMLGVSVYFEDKKIDTASYSSEMMLAMFGSIAQEESLSISSNMRWSYEKRMQAGEFITNTPPYGYRLEKAMLVIKEDEAVIVRRIFDAYLNGTSVNDIAQMLNSEQVEKKQGVWQPVTIQRILKNEKYIGDALLRKCPYYGSNLLKGTNMPDKRDQYYVENSHEPIIGHDTFERTQALLKMRGPDTMPPLEAVLRKMIWCSECGAVFKRRRTKKGDITWVCYSHDQGKDLCPTPTIRETVIKQAFLRMFGLLRWNLHTILIPMAHSLERLRNKAMTADADICTLDQSILAINGHIHVLNRLRSKGFMEPAVFQEKQNELTAQLEKTHKQREILLSDDDNDKSLERTEELIEIIEHAPENLASLEDGEVLSMIVDKVLIDKNKKIMFRLINGLELVGDGGIVND